MVEPMSLLQTAPLLTNGKAVDIPQYKLPAPTTNPVTELVKQLEQGGIMEKAHAP